MATLKLLRMNNIIYYPLNSELRSNYGSDNDNPYVIWTLYPVAIRDYINPDWSDAQGWVQEIDKDLKVHLQETYEILQYIIDESFNECIQDEGISWIELSTIYLRDYSELEDDIKAVQINIEDAVENALSR